MKSVVSEKGQITIPKRLRDRLGIRPGQVLDLDERGGELIARKRPSQSTVRSLYGIIDLGVPTDRFLDELRGPRSR